LFGWELLIYKRKSNSGLNVLHQNHNFIIFHKSWVRVSSSLGYKANSSSRMSLCQLFIAHFATALTQKVLDPNRQAVNLVGCCMFTFNNLEMVANIVLNSKTNSFQPPLLEVTTITTTTNDNNNLTNFSGSI